MVEKRLPWVLVVDDNEANRYAVGRTLRAAGFETSEASNGRQAIELAHTRPDAIVLDVNLPDINGFDVVRELRDDPATALIPILHLSASYMRDEDRVHGLDNGANAYLTHPIEPSVFVATIRSLMRVRQLEEQRETAAAEWRATFDAISDLVCVVDETGAISRANRAADHVLAPDGGTAVHRQWLTLMADTYPGLNTTSLATALARYEATAVEEHAGDCWLRIAIDPMPPGSTYEGSAVCVVTDITVRKAIENERMELLEDAEEARAQAESANRAKSEFLATMSHEIRTPINAILGYAQILDMGIAGPVSPEQRKQLDRMRRSTAHLMTLVNELLDLGKAESNSMRVQRGEISADEVLEDVLAIARPQANARGISIVADDDKARHVSFIGDTGRVRQILVNLLSNAVKFSDPGSRISLETEITLPPAGANLDAGTRYAAFHVRDTGVGVSPEQLAAIFEPFVQGETGPTRTWGGSGVGLAISRRLARLMGGEITVSSPADGGAMFTLWLPSAEDQSLVETAEQPASRLTSAPFDPTILSQLGRLLAMESLNISSALALRIRTDDRFPPAGDLSDAQLVDHLPTFATDLGLALITIAEVGIDASPLLHDGIAIRNEVAERHGAQRCRLGWHETHIAYEYELIRDEIERTLKSRAGGGEQQLEGALGLIGRLLDQSLTISLRGFREADAA